MRFDIRGPVIGERRTIRHVDPGSAGKAGFLLSVTISAIWLVGFFALYLLGLASGGVDALESFIVSFGITSGNTFSFNFLLFAVVFIILALIWSAFMAGVAAVTALLYNLLAEAFGGVEVVTRER